MDIRILHTQSFVLLKASTLPLPWLALELLRERSRFPYHFIKLCSDCLSTAAVVAALKVKKVGIEMIKKIKVKMATTIKPTMQAPNPWLTRPASQHHQVEFG